MRSTSSSTLPGLPDAPRTFRYLTVVDWALLASTLGLVVIGLATVHSASAELAIDYLPRQAVWVALGLVALVTVASLDYHTLLDLSPWLFAGALGSLVLVYFIGVEAGGAKSRLAFGSLTIQPSEFAKLATALVLARYLGGLNQRYLTLKNLLVAGAVTALPISLIALEPDYGSAAMFLPMVGGMVLVGGIRLRTWIAVGLLALVLGGAVWSFAMKPYQRQRVITFVAPETDPLGAGYQVRQSKIAVGSGGLTGRGYMQGTQSQLRFLPARHTDFVFAVLAEEWGFVGVLGTLGLFGAFLFASGRVALRARNRAGVFLVTALVSLLGFHVLYNTAMVVGLVPITGIPLPLLSYGGSFTLMTLISVGLILSVDLRRHVNR